MIQEINYSQQNNRPTSNLRRFGSSKSRAGSEPFHQQDTNSQHFLPKMAKNNSNAQKFNLNLDNLKKNQIQQQQVFKKSSHHNLLHNVEQSPSPQQKSVLKPKKFMLKQHPNSQNNLKPTILPTQIQNSKIMSQNSKEIQMINDKLSKIDISVSSKFSNRKIGYIYSYAANTHSGLFRGYNEDRVSIVLNINKPTDKQAQNWPKCSFFAVYDGHGGSKCADFLRDQLHQYIIKEECFPENPEEAIKRGVKAADNYFLKISELSNEKSGSCAVMVLTVDDILYIGNIGDSRAVLSCAAGTRILNVTNDHKPFEEQDRIYDAGGKVYQVSTNGVPNTFQFAGIKIQTPYRVLPGKLSVSRTLGDIDAKHSKYGGNPNVVICDPEVSIHKLEDDFDFIILASTNNYITYLGDGIYDRIESHESIQLMWRQIQNKISQETQIHKLGALAVEQLMMESLRRKTLDNITVVLLSFKNFEYSIMNRSFLNNKYLPKTPDIDQTLSPPRKYSFNTQQNSEFIQLEKSNQIQMQNLKNKFDQQQFQKIKINNYNQSQKKLNFQKVYAQDIGQRVKTYSYASDLQNDEDKDKQYAKEY